MHQTWCTLGQHSLGEGIGGGDLQPVGHGRVNGELHALGLGPLAIRRDRPRALCRYAGELRILPVDVEQRSVDGQAMVEPLAAQAELALLFRRRDIT